MRSVIGERVVLAVPCAGQVPNRVRAVLINAKQLFLHLRHKEQEKEVVTLHFVHPYAPSVCYDVLAAQQGDFVLIIDFVHR
jgi:hypothetical protein